MEITVISAQGLQKKSSGIFSHRRLRPFITITTYPPLPPCGEKNRQEFCTRVDDLGGVNPTWGDKFYVPLDAAFFANRYSCIYLQLYTRRLISGPVQLGSCQIPVSDMGFPSSEGSIRYLSYRIRERDGTRGHGVVNVAVRLTGSVQPLSNQTMAPLADLDRIGSEQGRTVIGIPVTTFSHSYMRICQ